ncbi:MAG: hypothetical protein R3E02_10165 [Blastomonas sp.]
MHRVDTPGSVDGLFQDGNPAVGQQATQLLAAWFNDVQENIAKVIEEAEIELEKGNYSQLRDALVAMIAGVVGDGDGAVPTTLTVTGGGLVTGGGDLTTNRVLTVTKASAAEVAAGTNDTKAVTPLALAGGIGSKLLAGAGYLPLLGGALIQWTPATALPDGSTNVSLPTSFPTACVWADFAGVTQLTDAEHNDPGAVGWGTSAVTLWSARPASVVGRVLAIGY